MLAEGAGEPDYEGINMGGGESLVTRNMDGAINQPPESQGLTASIEYSARIFCQALSDGAGVPNLSAISMQIWESEIA